MIQKLLVPLDGSGFGEETIPWAAALARSSGAEVDVAHVHIPHPPDHLLSNTQYQYEGVDMAEYDGRDLSEEQDYLDGVARRLAEMLGRPAHSLMMEGNIPDAIDGYAQKHGTGIIVMSTHGRTGFSRAWLGSVADTVVRSAPWPVLLVRPGRSLTHEVRFERIVVPLDGSGVSERILTPVMELAGHTEATLVLVRVVSPRTILGTRVLPVSAAALADAHGAAGEYLADAAGRLLDEGVRVEVRVVENPHPARGILTVVENEHPDLVAMATHGYRGVTRAVLGSVADKVLRAAEVPMLLLGPGVGG